MKDEFKMIQKAYRIAPKHVSQPFAFAKCKPVGSIIYSEYIDGKTLNKTKWITRSVLYQVLVTLYKFQTHNFRHNDVHLGNIIVENKTNRAVIVDFGLANTKALDMTNQYGIHPNSDLRYDYHLFLNWVYTGTYNPVITAFIKRMIPSVYLGQDTIKVKNFRLKYGTSYPGLPTLRQVIKSHFFDSCRKKNIR